MVATECPICALRRDIEVLEAEERAAKSGRPGCFFRDEPDRTVVTIYPQVLGSHRKRLLDLLIEIENTPDKEPS